MQVKDAMAHTISTVSPRDPIKRVAELMRQEDAGFMPVCEEDRLIGVITDRDIVIRCLADGHIDLLSEPAEHCMSREVYSVNPEDGIEEAARLMNQHEVRRLPVVEGGRVVGILSHGNLVQATHSDGPGDEATLGVTRGA